MALVLRCPQHPAYNGARVPGTSALIDPAGPDPAQGAQSCPDCWEVYRRAHEGEPAGL
jgi:hypothetical protein